LYFPGEHRLQATPSHFAEYPGRHVHVVLTSLVSDAVFVFGGHCWHVLGFSDAGLGWKNLIPHAWQGPIPNQSLNVPGLHGLQSLFESKAQ
jgi:hypothetical protein